MRLAVTVILGDTPEPRDAFCAPRERKREERADSARSASRAAFRPPRTPRNVNRS